jgi:GR25 family glycosyltransferase involved in LPS biosynthesis
MLIPYIIFSCTNNTKISYLHYLSIQSLLKFNPEYKFIIYNLSKTTQTDSNYTDNISTFNIKDINNLTIIDIDFENEFIYNKKINQLFNKNIELYNDFKINIVKLIKLFEHGGIYIDLDTLFLKELSKDILNKIIDIGFTYSDNIISTKFLVAKKNSYICNLLITKMFLKLNSSIYEYENLLFDSNFVISEITEYINNKSYIYIFPSEYVLPYTNNNIYKFFNTNINKITDNTFCINWFYDNKYSKYICDNFNKNTLINSSNNIFENIINKIIPNNLNIFFDNIPIYIINLNDSIERKCSIYKEFQGYYNIHFIEAIDGRDSSIFNKKYNVKYLSDIDYHTATISVICSHAKAIKTAYDAGHEKVCIFEDDIHTDLINTCKFTLNKLCNLNDDWECIQLYHITGNNDDLIKEYNDHMANGLVIYKRDKSYSGSCYIINRKGMKNILENVINVSSDMLSFNFLKIVIEPEDTLFSYINTYICNRQLFYYYFNKMTYNNFFNNNKTKDECEKIQKSTSKLLKVLYS